MPGRFSQKNFFINLTLFFFFFFFFFIFFFFFFQLFFYTKGIKYNDVEQICLKWSTLGKEVVETLLAMIEGRTDSVVQIKILAVVQPRSLKDR